MQIMHISYDKLLISKYNFLIIFTFIFLYDILLNEKHENIYGFSQNKGGYKYEE